MDAKRTLHVFDILYSMLLSSVSPSFVPFLRPNVAQTLAEGSFDRYAPLNIHFTVFLKGHRWCVDEEIILAGRNNVNQTNVCTFPVVND